MFSSFWKSGMETQPALDASLRERVAVNSIYSQKLVERFRYPEPSTTPVNKDLDPRLSVRPIYGIAHSDLKNSDAGTCSTFIAATHYADEKRKRRDELIAKYSNESTQ